MAKRVPLDQLSKRAQKLHARLMAGEWYSAYPVERVPQAMHELVLAGWVTRRGRVKVVQLCYVATDWKERLL